MSILGLSGGGGGAYIRFMPSANSWMLGKDEITLKKVYFDLDTVKAGWGLMAEGQAPQWVWDEALGKPAVKPGDDYRRGFSVKVYLGPDKGWAEWSSTGTGPCMGFDEFYVAAIQLQRAANQVVVANYTGSTAKKVGKGNTRVPNFEVAGVVERPISDDDIPPHDEPVRVAPPATGSRTVPPPQPKAATAAADMDFG